MYALETVSSVLGMFGALLLSVKSRFAGWAFVAYFVSNLGWILFVVINDHWWLVMQNVVFFATSVLGIWTWLIRPRVIGSGND